MRARWIVAAVVGALVGGLMTVTGGMTTPAPQASAADARNFDPGNIISDALFFDGGALNASQVQAFLNAKVSSCRPGYTCLKDYTQATTSKAAVSGRCDAYNSQGVESAAMIIAKVGAACDVSQKVILVLLEKEQSLVSDTWPGTGQYRSATGYGCPDTAACDSQYYGFFNQVYNAALQFKRYAASPDSWNHIAGRVNQIRYSPTASCGSSAVYIQNQATAGLYNYTPYQPNAAALANLYGTGDGCSAYGNRNFWRLYTDWFGSTTGVANLARTLDNSTVYVLSGTSKYPVGGLDLLSALAPLGPVAYVSQNYLDNFATGPQAGRVLRAANGTIYFFDSGMKLAFGSCGLVTDYGGSCSGTGYMQLTDAQLALFHTGPNMTSVMGTTTGARYYVTLGTKREILDDASQTAAGIPLGFNVLSDASLGGLALGTPILRDQAFVQSRGTMSYSFLSGGAAYGVATGATSVAGLPGRVNGTLSAASITKIPASPTPFAGVISVAGSSTVSVLTSGGRLDWVGGGGGTLSSVPVTTTMLATYPAVGSVDVGSFLKGSTPTVYVVGPSDLKPVSSWDALVALTPKGSDPVIRNVADSVLTTLPKGPTALTSGTLVRSNADATVYLVNGLTNKIPFTSFDLTSSIGINGFSFVSDAVLAGYPKSAALLGYGITCGTTDYVAASGTLRALDGTTRPLYPLTFTKLDSYTCAQLAVGKPATKFVRTPNGSIYLLDGGTKRPISSMDRFNALGGAAGWVDVTAGLAATIPNGTAA
ncbi:hypothetical protein [Leifsonia soli]|nr:hypothetical protein [Leifsonia soli]